MATAGMSFCFFLLWSSSDEEFFNTEMSVRTCLNVYSMYDWLYMLLCIGAGIHDFVIFLGVFLQLVCLFHGDEGGILRLQRRISMFDSCGLEES